jgi:hypothetical protein
MQRTNHRERWMMVAGGRVVSDIYSHCAETSGSSMTAPEFAEG